MKINHLGIAVKNVNISANRYIESLGWEKYSNVIHDPLQKVNILFMIDDNNNVFELLEPACEDSPLNQLLKKRTSLYHFCYEVNNIEVKVEELIKKGFMLITGPVEAVAFGGKQIAFLINWDNLIIELLEQSSAE